MFHFSTKKQPFKLLSIRIVNFFIICIKQTFFKANNLNEAHDGRSRTALHKNGINVCHIVHFALKFNKGLNKINVLLPKNKKMYEQNKNHKNLYV